MTLPILYSFRRCPYAMRARLALLASGTVCALREVVLSAKPQALRDASPKATVPVLVLPDGTVLEQSLDIMRWALACHDPHGWLAPDGCTPAAMDTLIAESDGTFKPALDRFKYPERHPAADGTPADPQAARAAVAVFLARLELRLAAQPWLGGRHAALADAAIAPFVRQCAAVDPAWFAAQPWPRLQAWLAAFVASPRFLQAMVRHPAWVPGAETVVFG